MRLSGVALGVACAILVSLTSTALADLERLVTLGLSWEAADDEVTGMRLRDAGTTWGSRIDVMNARTGQTERRRR